MHAKRFIQESSAINYEIPRNLGFSSISFESTEQLSGAIKSANSILSNYKSTSMEAAGKTYLRTIASISDLDPKDPIVKIALNDELLACVTKYLGVAPHLNSINVMWSPPSKVTQKSSSSWSGSQLFHIDGDSDGIVKVWILCNEVGEDNGPTTLIPANLSLRISKEISYSPKGKVKDDTPFIAVLDKAFKATGKAGTMFATDTARCFHQGSRTKENSERLVIMYFYDTFRSSWYISGFNPPSMIMSEKWKAFISSLPSHKKYLFRMLKQQSV